MPCYSDCPGYESKHLTVTNYVQFTAYEKKSHGQMYCHLNILSQTSDWAPENELLFI